MFVSLSLETSLNISRARDRKALQHFNVEVQSFSCPGARNGSKQMMGMLRKFTEKNTFAFGSLNQSMLSKCRRIKFSNTF
jgi:hypothetical protein